MKTLLLLLGLALACALWAPAAEASTIFRAPTSLGLAQGLVGHWSFDGLTIAGTRVFDASGSGNYGTMTNGPTLVNGKLGQGLSFDGSDDYVRVANESNFDFERTNPYSITVWIKAPASSTSRCIVNKAADSDPWRDIGFVSKPTDNYTHQ